MIIDCREWSKHPELIERERCRVFVDDVEIMQVWYSDTEAGFVCSYDVLGDKKAHATADETIDAETLMAAWSRDQAAGIEWDMPHDGVMSKTIRGRVTLVRMEP